MGKWVWPVSGTYKYIISGFGATAGRSRAHQGIDIVCKHVPVFAARSGKVTFVGYTSQGGGNAVYISHGNGWVTIYMHLRKFHCKTGQKVNAGQTIAESGGAPGDPGRGDASGAHLHFEIRHNGIPHNPLNYVHASDSVGKYTGGYLKAITKTSSGKVLKGGGIPGAVWRILMAHGYSPAAAAAVLGCMYIESAGFHLTAQNPSDGGIGLCQWTNTSATNNRRDRFFNFFRTHPKYSWKTVKGQMAFFFWEIDHYNDFAALRKNSFKHSKDPANALTIFMNTFEMPRSAGIPKYWNARWPMCKKYYAKFHNYTGGNPDGTSYSYSAEDSSSSKTTSKPITKLKIKKTQGKQGKRTQTALYKYPTVEKTGVEVLMQHGSNLYEPEIDGAIEIEWARRDTPGKMTFKVVRKMETVYDKTGKVTLVRANDPLKLSMGDTVRFRYNNKNVFLGFLFNAEETADGKISLTYYDQMRYFKNKDLIKLKKCTFSTALKTVCKRYGLKTGKIENTKTLIPAKLFDGTLFDALGEYQDLTTAYTGTFYTMYDNCGYICLRSLKSMETKIYIDAEQMQDFSYTSSIDENVYNCIKLYKDDSKTGTRKVWVRNSTAKQSKWGLLTYVEKTDETSTAKIMQKAKALQTAYGSIERTLELKDCFGDISVRGGSTIYVGLKLQDTSIYSNMVVDTVTHKFEDGVHTMDLKVIGKVKDGKWFS